MNPIHLDVTLSVVGPRADLVQQNQWPMALRVVAGFANPPANPGDATETQALVERSLPWNLWTNASLPDLQLVDERGNLFTCTPEPPLDEKPAFLKAVKDAVTAQGIALSRQQDVLDYICAAGTGRDVVDTDAHGNTGPKKVPWPGLLKSLSHLCLPTPSALRATWFFHVARSQICDLDAATGQWKLRAGAALAAAPGVLEQVAFTRAAPDTGHVVFEYGPDRRAYCNLLNLETAMGGGLDELDNYWLSIRDSRDDSLLDLARQLDAALTPQSMLAALSKVELAEYCAYAGGGSSRPCTPAELAEALAAWRVGLAQFDVQRVADERKAVIRETLDNTGDPADVMRQKYQTHAIALLQAKLPPTLSVMANSWEKIGTRLSEQLLPRMFERLEPGTATSGEQVSLVFGDERLRLVHESQPVPEPVDEVAAVQLWARRSSDPASMEAGAAKPAPWQPLTAGRYVPDGDADGARAGVDRVLGCSSAYVDGVLYRELPFVGMNMVCRNPLEDAHGERMGEGGELSLMLARLQRWASDSQELLAVPLRYGDHYEFAASVTDRAGGQARELTAPGQPWKLDLARLPLLDPPQRDSLHFLRRVPVGECKRTPPGNAWPMRPEGVVLRCTEEDPPGPAGESRAVVFLVPDDDTRYLKQAVPKGGKAAAVLASAIEFTLAPPEVDEFTAMRWLLPATNLPRAQQMSALEELHATITGMLRQRKNTPADGDTGRAGLLADPAVSAIGVRWRVNGGAPLAVTLPADVRTIRLEVDERTDFDGHSRFTVAPGSYVRIGLHALVSKEDFARFEEQAMAKLIELDDWQAEDGSLFRAFHEEVVIAECASDALPQPDAALLKLSATPRGDVDVSYAFSQAAAGQLALFKNVDTMSLAPRRWTWRNLPIRPEAGIAPAADREEWRRRLASGPTKALFDPTHRDADADLDRYDQRSAADTGFVPCDALKRPFPREILDPAATPRSSDALVLFRDVREDVAAADYLNYQWIVRSRYAAVLQQPERVTDDKKNRRIALPFRGNRDRIKPPRILAALPLLSGMPASPRPLYATEGNPFLIVLDEVWFREYGIGERLEARIALVKQEIGEDPPTARRFGPLPDHMLDSSVAKALTDPLLDAFGPFGFTLDATDDQALANASAFVVYPPSKTPPHYNLFVEFFRCLDLPTVGVDQAPRSEATEAIPLYTLPDSVGLWPATGALPGTLVMHTTADGLSYDTSVLNLAPYQGAHPMTKDQYRYLFIAGHMVRDGGRGVDVFVPSHALWLRDGQATPLGGDHPAMRACTHGLVTEILLNGRFPAQGLPKDPLADADSLRELFLRLLPDTVAEDAPGMFRRFSAVRKVTWIT